MIIRCSAEFVPAKSPLNCDKNADANDWFAGRADTPETMQTDPDLPLTPLYRHFKAYISFRRADVVLPTFLL